MHFDLIDLRLFLQVAEAGSITRGAERANLALASASARIRGMEGALGVALLQRERRGVRLTAAGRSLAEHARIVLEQMARLRGDLGQHARGLRGEVRLLSNTAALTEFLPAALADFLAAHPAIDIALEERPSADIVPAVAEGLADAGIVADAVDLSGLERFPLRPDRLVLVVPSKHRLATRRQIAFRDALDHDFVGLSEGSALQTYLRQHAARAGRPLKLRVRLSSFDAVCRLVAHGVGLGVIPEAAAQRCRRSMAIRTVRLTDPWSLRQLTICVRRFDRLPAPARQLIEHLKAHVL
jgi:DNA-binding transcriptional LysR family regulator